jgi:hypothetical protein
MQIGGWTALQQQRGAVCRRQAAWLCVRGLRAVTCRNTHLDGTTLAAGCSRDEARQTHPQQKIQNLSSEHQHRNAWGWFMRHALGHLTANAAVEHHATLSPIAALPPLPLPPPLSRPRTPTSDVTRCWQRRAHCRNNQRPTHLLAMKFTMQSGASAPIASRVKAMVRGGTEAAQAKAMVSERKTLDSAATMRKTKRSIRSTCAYKSKVRRGCRARLECNEIAAAEQG